MFRLFAAEDSARHCASRYSPKAYLRSLLSSKAHQFNTCPNVLPRNYLRIVKYGLHFYYLRPWGRVLLHRSLATQEIPRILWHPKVHYRIHRSPSHARIIIRDKWVNVTRAWRVLRLRMEERPTDMDGSCGNINLLAPEFYI
jgi:hypothetical protein